MNKKEKQLIVSGQTIDVNLGSGYFYEFFQEATGVDLIEKGVIQTDMASTKVFKYLQGFIYAGNRAFNAIRNKDCDMTLERARHIAFSIEDTDTLMNVFYECLSGMAGVTTQELKNVKTQESKKSARKKSR